MPTITDELGIPEFTKDEVEILRENWRKTIDSGGIDVAKTIIKYMSMLNIPDTPDTRKMGYACFGLGRNLQRVLDKQAIERTE